MRIRISRYAGFLIRYPTILPIPSAIRKTLPPMFHSVVSRRRSDPTSFLVGSGTAWNRPKGTLILHLKLDKV